MQMFPDVSFGSETRLRGEVGESSKRKHGISEHGPTLISAFSVGTFMSAFRSLTVISDRNDKRKLSENVLFPISDQTLFFPDSALIGRCSGAGTRRLGGEGCRPYEPDQDKVDQDEMIQTNFISVFIFLKHRPPVKNKPALDCHLLVRGSCGELRGRVLASGL